jgi:hypothetical protein
MTLTTRVRFLAPVDPRLIWAEVRELLDAPADYQFQHNSPGGRPLYEGDFWPWNGEYYAQTDQGLTAHAHMEYGHEGAPLREEWDVHPESADEYPVDKRPPVGYAELSLDTCYSDDYEAGDIHAGIIAKLAQRSPVPIAWQLEYMGEWFGVTGEWLGVSELHRIGAMTDEDTMNITFGLTLLGWHIGAFTVRTDLDRDTAAAARPVMDGAVKRISRRRAARMWS